MEKSDNSSWLTKKLKAFLRNVVLLMNATLWFLVLYHSIHDDAIAAILSYVSVTLTILTVKCYTWEVISNSKSVAYFIDCSSKTLILAGLSLVLLREFWNTAFYSICLGIVMQTVKGEIQGRARNEILHLHLLVSGKDDEIESTDDMKVIKESENEAHEMQINRMKDVNENECCTSVSSNDKNDFLLKNATGKQNIEIVQREELSQKEMQKFDKLNKCHPPDISETMSDHEEIVVSCNKENNFGDQKESDKNEKLLHDYNSQRQTVSMEAVESTLKRMEYFTQSNVVTNYTDSKETKSTEEACTLQIQLLNLQDLELSEYSKLESKFELNKSNIERELKRNGAESISNSVKYVGLNENLKDSSKDDTKQLDTADKSMETITEPGNKVQNEFYPEQVNNCSDANLDYSENCNENEFIVSYSAETLFRTNQSEGKCEIHGQPVCFKLFIKRNENLFLLNSDSTLDTSLQHNKNTWNVNSQKVDTDSQRENTSENDGSSNSEPKYKSMNCTSEKIKIQSEKQMSAYHTKCIHENFYDQSPNFNASSDHKERICEACSTYFETNRENFINETDLQENSFETNKNSNSEVKHSNMNCTYEKSTNIQLEKDIFQKKFVSQQVNVGKSETALGANNKVLPESKYSFKRNCLYNSSRILDDKSKLNEWADVEEKNYTNKSMKKASGDEVTTPFSNVSNVDDVVNRIDLGFIYALEFNTK